MLISGAPATGKSSLAHVLAPRLRAALIDQDVTTGPLVNVVASMLGVHDLDDPRLATLTRGPRYDTILRVAEDNLRVDRPVILVAPFTAERGDLVAWQLTHGRLAATGATVRLVWLRLPPEHILGRLRRRAAARDEAKLADESTFLAELDQAAPVGPHLALDARMTPGQLTKLILDDLSR